MTADRLLATLWFLLGWYCDCVSPDFERAARWYLRGAEAGCARAQFRLGLMYEVGRGVERDRKEALRWIRQAAEAGHDDAQNRLGAMYYRGQGVLRDYVSAHQWFRIAGENGNLMARKAVPALGGMMTPAQREEAARRAEAWFEKHGRKWWR